jgi:hypothetical protein
VPTIILRKALSVVSRPASKRGSQDRLVKAGNW